MIIPLKIAVWSLKSVKQLPGVQNDSLAMNTLRSLDSPVVNTPGSLSSPVVNTPGSLDSPVVNTAGSLDYPLVNKLGSLGSLVITSEARLPCDEYIGESITNATNFANIR